MIKGYTKGSRQKLQWTSDLEKVYYQFKDAVANCGKLFVDDDKLMTTNKGKFLADGIASHLFMLNLS